MDRIDRDKLIERIKALFNLGDKTRNNSEEEAATATKMAQQLLQRYNLSMSEITEKEQKEEPIVDEMAYEFKRSAMSTWEKWLANVVGDACEVKPYINTNWTGVGQGKKFKVQFVGTQWDVAIAKELYIYLHSTIKQLSVKNYPNALPSQRSYMEGCVCRLNERIKEQNKQFRKEQEGNQKFALMVVNKKDAIDKYCQSNLALKSNKKRSGSGQFDADAYYKGRSDADKFDLGTENRIKGDKVDQPNQLT